MLPNLTTRNAGKGSLTGQPITIVTVIVIVELPATNLLLSQNKERTDFGYSLAVSSIPYVTDTALKFLHALKDPSLHYPKPTQEVPFIL